MVLRLSVEGFRRGGKLACAGDIGEPVANQHLNIDDRLKIRGDGARYECAAAARFKRIKIGDVCC